MLAPFAPFVTEYIYNHMFKDHLHLESVHMLNWPYPDEKWFNSELESLMNVVKKLVEASSAARQSKGVKLRRPVRRVIIATKMNDVLKAIDTYRDLLLEQLNTKELIVCEPSKAESIVMDVAIRLNYAKAGPKYRGEVRSIAEQLLKIPPENVLRALEEEGIVRVELKGRQIELSRDMVIVERRVKDAYASGDFGFGHIYIDLTPTKELEAEALARELVRRIQFMRKELNLEIDEYIEVEVVVPSIEAKELALEKSEYISGEVRAKSLSIVLEPSMDGYRREWLIDEEKYLVTVRRALKD